MMNQKDCELLRIYISENDQHDGIPLYEWIVKKAQEKQIAGATVLRGLEGFGADKQMHTAKILILSNDLPLVVEIVDSPEKIAEFIPCLDEVMKEGIVTTEKVNARFYHKSEA